MLLLELLVSFFGLISEHPYCPRSAGRVKCDTLASQAPCTQRPPAWSRHSSARCPPAAWLGSIVHPGRRAKALLLNHAMLGHQPLAVRAP